MSADKESDELGGDQNKWKDFADKLEKRSKKHVEQEKLKEKQAKKKAKPAESLVEADESRRSHGQEGIDFPSRQKLEDQLTAMEMKLDEYKNNYIKAHAEMKNLQQRTEREISNARKFGAERLVVDLLPVTDSLIRGLEGASEDIKDPHAKSMFEGLQLTLDLLHNTMEKHGVESINPEIGDEFNPELHEAVTVQEQPGSKANTVLQVLQRGYQLNGRVLRAAMVIVAK